MELTMRNKLAAVELTALVADTATALEWPESDERMVLVLQNTATSPVTVTVKAGNGLQGMNDLTLSLGASSVNLVKLDSGRYKNVSGENKGKIVVVSSSTPKVGVAAIV